MDDSRDIDCSTHGVRRCDERSKAVGSWQLYLHSHKAVLMFAAHTIFIYQRPREATMTWKDTAARWGSLSIGLHWLMLILMVGV